MKEKTFIDPLHVIESFLRAFAVYMTFFLLEFVTFQLGQAALSETFQATGIPAALIHWLAFVNFKQRAYRGRLLRWQVIGALSVFGVLFFGQVAFG